jgi:hypothetical protein
VLITEPIENLDIKGTFHLDRAIIILEILETEYYWWWSESVISTSKIINRSFSKQKSYKISWRNY